MLFDAMPLRGNLQATALLCHCLEQCCRSAFCSTVGWAPPWGIQWPAAGTGGSPGRAAALVTCADAHAWPVPRRCVPGQGSYIAVNPMLIRMNLDGGWELGPMAKATNFCTSGVSCWRGLAYALPITLYPRGCQMEAHEEATPLLLSFDSWNRFWGIIWPGLHSHAGPDEYFAIDAFDCVLLVDAIYQTALLLWCWWNTGIIVSSHGWWMWEGDSDAWGHWHQSWLN
jgi:hypothetical protein